MALLKRQTANVVLVTTKLFEVIAYPLYRGAVLASTPFHISNFNIGAASGWKWKQWLPKHSGVSLLIGRCVTLNGLAST
jgi:hypothetical protein